jgi:hypothetical protein
MKYELVAVQPEFIGRFHGLKISSMGTERQSLFPDQFIVKNFQVKKPFVSPFPAILISGIIPQCAPLPS